MPPLRQMNGQPIRYATVTDFGQPGRRSIYSSHITAGAARRSIHKFTKAGWGGGGPRQQWWIAEIDPANAAGYDDIKILAYLPEGPYGPDHRPDAASRQAP